MPPKPLVSIVEELSCALDAGEILECLAEFGTPFLLDSGSQGRFGRVSVVGLFDEPLFDWRFEPSRTDFVSPFEVLRQHLQSHRAERHPRWPFVGGVLAYFGYPTRHLLEVLPERHAAPKDMPDAMARTVRLVVLRDEHSGECAIAQLQDPKDRSGTDQLRNLALRVRQRLVNGPAPRIVPPALAIPRESWIRPSRRQHLARLARAHEHILDGDVYELNLAHAWSLPKPPDLLRTYRTLRHRNPPTFGAYVPAACGALLSLSPERFLVVDGREVRTRPIKGTSPRFGDAALDKKSQAELLSSRKDAAELAMIVDVLRNDLSRVCVPGTVRVPEFKVLESHPTVHHLVAEIQGHLREGSDVVDLLMATLPGGSITGAPKIRAMEIIDALEAEARGPYCGTLCWLGYDGRMDSNILIRTAYSALDRLIFHGGGGITILSDAELECDETVHKVRGFLESFGASGNPEEALSA